MTLPRRVFLGAALPPDEEAFTPRGLRIIEVLPEGTAMRAELAAGDLVVSIGGRALRDLPSLAAALRVEGDVEIVFERGDEQISRTVEAVPAPREEGLEYAELAVDGTRLRTFTHHAVRPRATVVAVQGIACETVEGTPLATLAAAWARAGYSAICFDKRGVGDSEGNATDFATELGDARAVAATVRGPLVVFGHSVGGIIAPLLARDGAIVYGAPVMPWIDCLVDSARRQLALRGAGANEISDRVAAIHRLTAAGELNGRSAEFHAQLAAHDTAATWRAVSAPVLVMRGEHDWVVDPEDQARIEQLAGGSTTIVDVRGLDHLLGWHHSRERSLVDYGFGAADDELANRTIAWLDEQLTR